MPFDSNGVFSRVMNWTSDQQNGIAIECGRHDAEDNNFAEGFNETFCRDGRAAATGNFNLGNHKIQNLADGIAATDAVTKGQLDASSAAGVSLNTDQTITGAKTFTVSPNVPTPATSDNSTKVATTEYVKNQGCVHIAGTETITGTKTFTQNVTVSKSSGANLIIKLTDATQGTPPASGEYNGFLYFRDANDAGLGAIKFAYQSSGVSYMNMYAWKHDGSGNNPSLGVYCDEDNLGYATAPSTRTDRNSNADILTRDWIPKDTRIVHTTGNESISGTKTFATDIIETIGVKRNVTPSSNQYRGIGIHDSDDNMYMSFLGAVDTSKNASAFMRVFNPNNTSTSSSDTTYFTLHYDADGSKYATSPASAKTHSVVTTESITKSGTGALKLGNGVIIQWGNLSVTKNTTHTVTMPLAYSSTSSYRLSFMPISNTTHHTMPTITTKGTKSFGIKIGDWDDTTTLDWIAIGY